MLNYEVLKKACINAGIPVLDDPTYCLLINVDFGRYITDKKSIAINKHNHTLPDLPSFFSLENSIAHEFAHAMQDRYNMLRMLSWDKEVVLMREVTAQSCAGVVCGVDNPMKIAIDWFIRNANLYLIDPIEHILGLKTFGQEAVADEILNKNFDQIIAIHNILTEKVRMHISAYRKGIAIGGRRSAVLC